MTNILKLSRDTLKYLLKLILGLALLTTLIIYTGIEESIVTLKNIDLHLLTLAFLCHSTSWIFRVMRLKELFSDQGMKNINTKELYKINFAGYTLNIILPFKLGDVGRMYMFHKETKIPLKESITTVIYTRIFDILTLSTFGIISLSLIINKNPANNLPNYTTIFILMTALIIFLTSTTIQAKFARLTKKKSPQLSKIISSFKLSKKCRIKSYLYSVLVWLADGFTIYIILKGLNQDVSLAIAFLGLVVANIVKSFPTTPGGIGLFEGSMAFLFITLGINQNIAIVTATLDHFIKNITTIIFGIPSLISYKYDIKTLRHWSIELKKKVYKTG